MGALGALQFLTRIPVRLRSAPNIAASVPWFPTIGALIGALIGGVAAGMIHLVPGSVAAAVAVMVGIMVTGAFHEDGLADTADALGGWTPERRREILKDSRHGSYGVAAMAGTIIVRVACIASLGPAAAFAGLVAAHTLGRSAAVVAMATAPPVPDHGLGADYIRSLSRRRVMLGATVGLAIVAAAIGWWVLPTVAVAAFGTAIVLWMARRAFGGVSGDILGAVEQIAECLVLIVVSGLALGHTVWWAR
jgi:adenosylcobinamide-GDP ribazoletransferase